MINASPCRANFDVRVGPYKTYLTALYSILLGSFKDKNALYLSKVI